MKYAYAALFQNDEDWINVKFVDCPDWFTCGKNISEAIEYAVDMLNIRLYDLEREGKAAPPATPIEQVKLKGDQLVRMIEVDTDQYAPIAEQLANNPIRYAREQTGMSIKELADYLGAPYRTVQDWNAGLKRPPRWCEQLVFDKIMQAK